MNKINAETYKFLDQKQNGCMTMFKFCVNSGDCDVYKVFFEVCLGFVASHRLHHDENVLEL